MSGTVKWIIHADKEILLNDRSGLSETEIIENSDRVVNLIKSSGKRDILYLVDNSDTIIVPRVKEHIKKGAREVNSFIRKVAVVGASYPQRVLLNTLSIAIGMNIRVFEDMDSARDWLVK